ncbi:phosphodiesterase [Labrys monachus]|uniref:3',5'-cyclic AMP phosphodiesterase CpdA n=1 Tax=Labrys monachus TaxID=217067 RepID=A0ABU0FFR5_9HYPH|nr:phosphodiesterase [Labrys monachus]MDQ0393443.1 3',5'-cyclic AMP phosphodiesterase CpdA [Labrys monachus]
MKIIHLSDIHMCPPGQHVVGFDPAARLAAVVDTVNAEHADADLCVVSGDLTDAGDEPSYRRLKPIIETISVPVHLMLGNHDRRGAFLSVFPEVPTDGHGFVQSTVEIGDFRVILLDTLDEARPSDGYLCEMRLSWLERELAKDPSAKTIVFLHHPPFSLGVEYFDAMLLRNGAEFEHLLDRHRTVVHVAFGHVHFPAFGLAATRSFSASRGTCHPIRTTLAGMTATYIDRPPGYDILLADRGRVIVHPMQTATPSEIVAKEDADGNGGAGSIEVFRQVMSEETKHAI